MSQKFDDILALCLDNIEQGVMTLDECLAAYPDHADALTDLLAAESSLRTFVLEHKAETSPRAEFLEDAESRLLSKLSAETPHSPQTPNLALAPKPQSNWLQTLLNLIGGNGSRQMATVRYAFAGLLVLLTISTGTLYASQQSLPGETLYPVKTSIETAQLNRATDTDNKYIDLQLQFADKRLGEIEQLAAKEAPEHITITSEQYAQHLQATLLRIVDTNTDQSRETYKSQLGTVVNSHNERIVKLEPVVAKLAEKQPDSDFAPTIVAVKKAAENGDVYVKTGVYSKDITRITLMDVLRTDTKFGKVSEGLKAEAMQDMLTLNGPFTVFVPTDAAIAELPEPWQEAMQDNAKRRQTLLYHIIQGEYDEDQLRDLSVLTTAHGTDLNITVFEGEILLNGIVRVIETDITTDNGVIHYIDKALIPLAFE